MVARRYINFGVSPEDYALIASIAKEANLSTGQYARLSALQSANMRILEDRITAIEQNIVSTHREDLKKVTAHIINTLKK